MDSTPSSSSSTATPSSGVQDSLRIERLERAVSLMASKMKQQEEHVQELETLLRKEIEARRSTQDSIQRIAERFQTLVLEQGSRTEGAFKELLQHLEELR